MKIPNSFVCSNCKADQCGGCVDVLRVVYAQDLICKCKRKKHSGEPADNQIADPFDGSVHGPGAIISQDGQVEFSEEFRQWWRDTFE